ncbi:MAG: hypothetical protein ACOVRN_00340 [Flavobacterium sp.]
MKKFIDPKGNYIIFIPSEWSYKNAFYEAKDSDPNSFELYENSVGCFQISCNHVGIGKIPDLILTHKLESQEFGKNNLHFKEISIPGDNFDCYIWMAVVGENFVMCKYISDNNSSSNEKIKEEINKAKTSINSLLFIEDKYKNQVLADERFNKFMISLGASIDLKNRAYANNSPIELVILLANQIDALLRLVLILHKQLKLSTEDIDISLIFQSETDKPIMEKKVYDMALKEAIISSNLHNELYSLYNQRNKVVHRYIITDLLTRDVMKLAIDYGLMEEKIGSIVKQYEQEQFKNKIGIYGSKTPPNEPLDDLRKAIIIGNLKEKHAHKDFNNGITFEIT